MKKLVKWFKNKRDGYTPEKLEAMRENCERLIVSTRRKIYDTPNLSCYTRYIKALREELECYEEDMAFIMSRM